MPRTLKPWFLTKAREFDPTKTLQVGQILVQRDNPAHSLMPGGPLPVPANIHQEDSFQGSVDIDSKDELGAMFRLWGKVQGAPVGGKVGTNISRLNDEIWHFEKLAGKIISPSEAYVKDSLKHGDVPSYTNRFHVIKRLYMITGVRVAHGARMTKKESRSVGMEAELKGDANQVGGPVEGGIKSSMEKKNEDQQTFQRASDFVYAYRLSEINYWGDPTHKPFVGGEVAGELNEEEEEEEEEEIELEPCVGGLVEEFDEADLPGMESVTLPSAQDEEVEYRCFVAV